MIFCIVGRYLHITLKGSHTVHSKVYPRHHSMGAYLVRLCTKRDRARVLGIQLNHTLACTTLMARIREVWAPNLEAEMRNVRDVVERYPYVAMVSCSWSITLSFLSMAPQDTEFPGVVARPIGTFRTSSDYHYQTMRCNVDLLKIIQIGLTFSDEEGHYPEDVCTWQFNFHFSVK